MKDGCVKDTCGAREMQSPAVVTLVDESPNRVFVRVFEAK
jgi:hypothetical protein